MKITLEQQEKGKKLHQELVQKAWESATFKEQLINNPEIAISEVTGVTSKLIEDTKIVVEDQTDSNIIYLNIPQKVNLDDFELTEEQMEMVAGGILVSTALALAAIYLTCFGTGVAVYAATH
ncbi:hypothetical protein [Polaribacter sp. Q13]|uniref:hypothetical protein n=1 Tax=Polaribacter sp. Q13 TaxID=2806551 RepID=UPI00193C0226|nr:hypothetical protein [Polaribacter sp. Q13]QVY64641.1 hypothetical protein JOP69_12790 [Polaribacter sp. Q13]